MNKNKALKIIVPVLMLAVIAGIYIIQNQAPETQATDSNLEFPLHVSDANFDELSQHGLPIIVDFGATECEPCKAMAPVLETVNAQMQGKAIIQFVDVWENVDAGSQYPFQVIPSQFFINADGTAFMPSDELKEEIHFTLYGNNETQEHIYTMHSGALTQEQMLAILAEMGAV